MLKFIKNLFPTVSEDNHIWRFKAVRPKPNPSEVAKDNHTWRFKSDNAIIESAKN